MLVGVSIIKHRIKKYVENGKLEKILHKINSKVKEKKGKGYSKHIDKLIIKLKNGSLNITRFFGELLSSSENEQNKICKLPTVMVGSFFIKVKLYIV